MAQKQLTEGGRPLPTDVFCSGHMDFVLDVRKLHASVELAVQALKHLNFDALAFRGMSGAMIAPPVAMRLNKSLILVRKPHEQSHSCHEVEGDRTARRYIIIDDFQSSGATARTIKRAIAKFTNFKAVCLGVLPVREMDCFNCGPSAVQDIFSDSFESYKTDDREQLRKDRNLMENLEYRLKVCAPPETKRPDCVVTIPYPVAQENARRELNAAMAVIREGIWRVNEPPAMFGGLDKKAEVSNVSVQEKTKIQRAKKDLERFQRAFPRNIFGAPDQTWRRRRTL